MDRSAHGYLRALVCTLLCLPMATTTASTQVKIRLRDVRKAFVVRGRTVDAVAGIDLDIGAGEFFCIVGPSGCGKTTLLRILAGLETKTSGSIQIARDGWTGIKSVAMRPLNSMVF